MVRAIFISLALVASVFALPQIAPLPKAGDLAKGPSLELKPDGTYEAKNPLTGTTSKGTASSLDQIPQPLNPLNPASPLNPLSPIASPIAQAAKGAADMAKGAAGSAASAASGLANAAKDSVANAAANAKGAGKGQ